MNAVEDGSKELIGFETRVDMASTPEVRTTRVIRRFRSHEEQEAETMRYWRERSVAEKMTAATELAEYAYRMRGIDVHARGPKGPVVRFQRGGR